MTYRFAGWKGWAPVAALVVVSASACPGAEMDRKQIKALESAVKGLDKLEGKLATLETEKGYSDRNADGLERDLGRAQEKLGELPAEGEGVGAALERVKALQARLKAAIEQHGTLGQKAFLGPKPAATINNLVTRLENLQAEIKNHEPGSKYDYNDRARDRLQRQVGDIEEKLAELPADNPVVKQLAETLAARKADLARLGQGLEADKAAAANLEAQRAALQASPAFAVDTARATALVETFKERGLFDLSNFYLRAPLDDVPFQAALAILEQWPGLKTEFEAFQKKYGVLQRGEMWLALRQGAEWLPAFEEQLSQFRQTAPTTLLETRQQIEKLASEAVAAKNHRAFTDVVGDLRKQVKFATRVAALLTKLGVPGHESFGEQLATKLAQEESKLEVDIVAGNRAPKTNYAGADRGELEAFVREQWGKHFAQEEVLAVRFHQENWSRTVAWRWDKSKQQAYKVDQSDLWITVVVARGEEAVLYSTMLRKLHLEGDRQIIRWDRPTRLAPSDRMLRKNLD